jgi:outer membrane protein OmpA-like peptidoglycan-associated protein
MRNHIVLLLSVACVLPAKAQKKYTPLPLAENPYRWCIDANLLGGYAWQDPTTAKNKTNYPDAINSNIGNLKFNNGYSYGADVQLGAFFGQKRHFGIGTGLMFMEQKSDATLSNYNIEYRSTDASGNTFRQIIVGNNVKENITSTIVNIPVVLKYKDRFSKHWGISADAGALINLQFTNAYTTSATFDQGAIYKIKPPNDGNVTSEYDNLTIPSTGDWLITKANFLKNNPNGNWQEYARIKRAAGINVGDELPVNNRRGTTAYQKGSVGLILQPSVNYYLSNVVIMNLGGYFMLQPFQNNSLKDYRLTNGNGSYSSVLNNITASTNYAVGINAGVRILFGRSSNDIDRDGVADNKDRCPDIFGLPEFEGCPDTDKDGIEDKKDSCLTVWGLAHFAGCPDSDNDSIIDKLDDCPYAAGLIALSGCPDRDMDGTADKKDRCPDSFGLAEFYGCPDSDGDGIPNNLDKCPGTAGVSSNLGCPEVLDSIKTTKTTSGNMNTPILFEVNLFTLKSMSEPIIEDAIHELNKDNRTTLTIDGHADSSGPEPENIVLSLNRANAVKAALIKGGIKPSRLKTFGHGSSIPEATNSTPSGKERNRRVKMKMH